jgi:ParB family chromosome partitioning protein
MERKEEKDMAGAAGKRLGKGLRAIVNVEETAGGEVREIDITNIEPNEYQPRRSFDEEEIAQLAESIKKDGILQPILVRREGDDRYRLIFGERRWRAATLAGVTKIPAIIKDASEEESFRWALVENLQRKDLNPIEKARALSLYMEKFSLTQDKVGELLGMARPSVTNLLRLLALPEEVQKMVEDGELTFGHARALLAFPQDRIVAEARKIVKGRLPVRKVEHKASKKSVNDKALEEGLSEKLMRRVTIRRKKKGGVVEIEYYSDEDLNSLIDRLYSIR